MNEAGGTAGAEGAPVLGFKPHLGVAAVRGEAVYLIAEDRVTALRGRHIDALAPLLDGTRDRATVLAESSATLGTTSAAGALDRLDGAGLLCERPADPSCAPEFAYWELAGAAAGTAVSNLAGATVHLTVTGATDPAEALRALHASGLRPARDAGSADLTVAVVDDYLDPALSGIDAAHRAAGRPWLPVKPGGLTSWIGPFLGVPDGPCLHCLTVRLWQRRQAEAHVQRSLGRTGPAPRPAVGLPAGRAAALQLALLESAKWLGGHRRPGHPSLISLDTLTLDTGRHPVTRRPECGHCGAPELTARRVTAPVRPVSRPKRDTGGGGHRALSPQQVWERYGHLVDPVTGPVDAISRDPRGPAFLNCFHAGLNPVGPGTGIGAVRAGLRSTSSGKGVTEAHARVSALCEALERRSGTLHGDEPRLRGSYRRFADEAVHPDAVQLFDRRQLDAAELWNSVHAPVHHVTDPFDEEAETDWTPVWSLTGQRRRLLPTALLYYGTEQPPGRRWCFANSNGAAAGASLEDAVLQGFLELVERDAVALWWYNRTVQPGVELDGNDPWTAELRSVHAALGREVWALDLTTDFGIPVVAALSRRTDKAAEDIMLGFGAHFDPRIALRRALTEVNQMLPPVVDARADGTGYDCADPHVLDWMRTATLAGRPYLAAGSGPPARYPVPEPRSDLLHDIEHITELVRGKGMELLVLDQARADTGLPVAKVIVPGMRPHWARLGPGRLFDVPVRLGRRTGPVRYEDLNPVPLFL